MKKKKIMHIMKGYGARGIPSYSYFIPFHLGKNYQNYTLLTRQRLPKFKMGEKLPRTEYIPNKSGIVQRMFSFKPNVLIIYHHFGSPWTSVLLLLSKILHTKTIIVTDFAEIYLPKLHKSPFKLLRDIVRYSLFSSQLSLVDVTVCFTKYEKEVLLRNLPVSDSKFRIIPIGADFEIGTSKKENYILTVSRWWRDRKNLHMILRVFGEVVKNRKCKLLIVGKFLKGRDVEIEVYEGRRETGEEYEEKIMKLISELNLKNHVEFVGVKVGKKLQELFRKAKIYYLPSKYETFGMVFAEAMAFGTPIVAMKNSAVQYIVKDEVTGFLRNTEEEQEKAILKLLMNNKLYTRMQKNCLKEAEKYKWENVIKKWEKII